MVKRLLFILLITLPLSACSPQSEGTIVGTWRGETIQQDFHFYADGRLELNDHKYSQYRGRYTITEGNILTCEFESNIFTAPVVRTMRIKGDKLILTDKRGGEEVYVR